MKSIFKVVFYLLVLFIYSSLCLHAALFWYDAFPRFLAGLFFIFLLPIGLCIFFIYTLKIAETLFPTPNLPTHMYTMSVGIIGSLMWLGILGLLASDAPKYALLEKYEEMRNVSYADSARYISASYLSLSSSKLLPEFANDIITSSTPTKSTGQRTYWHNYVVPVVPQNFTPNMQVKVWIGIIGTMQDINPEEMITQELIRFPAGLVMRDPYDIPELTRSARESAKKLGTTLSENPVFLLPLSNYEESKMAWKKSFQWAVYLNWFFFVLLPFVVVHWALVRKMAFRK